MKMFPFSMQTNILLTAESLSTDYLPVVSYVKQKLLLLSHVLHIETHMIPHDHYISNDLPDVYVIETIIYVQSGSDVT